MIGILLLSANNCYADMNGGVEWGPAEDKLWVRNFIYNKSVFVGKATWKTIDQFSSLIDLPHTWQFEHPMNAEVHFGGPKSFKKFPPTEFFIHRLYDDIEGKTFDMQWLEDNYELKASVKKQPWEELYYVKK